MEKILILGGTNFIGKNLVELLLKNNQYEITLFNRGLTNATAFPDIQLIKGDRYSDDIQQLKGKKWDYVIDVSCYFPKNLNEIIESVRPNLKKYIFISTCSVYQTEEILLRDETAKTLSFTPEECADTSNQTYGKRKAACEAILQATNINYTILRPALVYGKYDHTDRFYYWLHQLKKYNSILLPNHGKQQISLTYVEDLVNIIAAAIQPNQDKEIYNTTSLPKVSIAETLKIGEKLLHKTPKYFNADSAFLNQHKVQQWLDLPLWIDCNYYTYDNKKVQSKYNVSLVDFKNAIQATINYYDSLYWHEPIYGINRSKQEQLIHKSK